MENKTPEEKTREGLNKLNEKLNKFKKSRIVRRVLLIVVALILTVTAFIFVLFSIKVKDINVTGDLRFFNETRVAEASEIEIGKSFFKKTSFGIKRSIRKNIPLADEIKVRKNIFTGAVNIEVTFSPFDYYVEYKGAYYAVDENLLVLDVRKTENDYASLGGRRVDIPKICKPVIGKELVFYDTVENPDGDKNFNNSDLIELRDKSEYDYVYDILKELKQSDNYSTLTSINLKEKYDIYGVYSERFKVEFGSLASFDLKVQMLSGILADTSWQYSEFGLVDLTNPSAATARAVQSIEDEDDATEDPEEDPDVTPEEETTSSIFGN